MKSIFVYNPESGSGKLKKHKEYIIQKLSTKFGEIDVVETTHSGHAKQLAKESVGTYDYFFVSGGDGTLNEVINGMGNEEKKPIIGYIPSGTVNDVAHSLGLSKNIKKAVRNILEGEPFAHDMFKVNDKYGLYVCCSGLFSQASYSTSRGSKKSFGKIAYFLKGAIDIFKTKPVEVELVTKEETVKQNCALVLILNSKSVAGFKSNKKAELDDGKVDVVLFHSHKKRIGLAEILRIAGAFIRGLHKYKNNKQITYRQLSDFKINLKEGTIINLDGEKSGEGSFNFQVIQSAVKIIAPKEKHAEKSKN